MNNLFPGGVMIDRRHFVKITAGAAMGGIVGFEDSSPARAAQAVGGRSLDRIGVQLYTVRTLMEKDFEGTLGAVAEIGFDEVEFFHYFGREPQQVRDLLDRLRLETPAAHFSWQALTEDPDAVIETALAVGHRYVLLAWLPPEDRSSVAQYQDLAALCNEVGKACTSAGLQFAYHNHDFEFQPIDGQVPFDVLLNETDPDHVEFEIDLYWIIKAGRDPLDYFEAHPGRFTLCHVKDMAEAGAMADVGNGHIDFATIFAKSQQAGLKYFFVEHDEPPDPLASIEASFDYLKRLRF
jgi:sugar phosphate isomerase/epimerase